MTENIKQTMDRIMDDGVITREEHDEFMDLVMKDGEVDAEESLSLIHI